MKPTDFVKKVSFTYGWGIVDSKAKEMWERFKDKDCVVKVMDCEEARYILALEGDECMIFCNYIRRAQLFESTYSLKEVLKLPGKTIYEDKDKLLIMEL